jgi:murein DD-endopeptidase MepM/ murein hydrolase activator NlpD
MRRLPLALLLVLALAAPALGDNVGRKQSVDAKIAALHGRLASQKQKEADLRTQIAGVTDRIRGLEARVGDVSLRLETLQQDLALHQERLDKLTALFRLQTNRFETLKRQYALAKSRLNTRLVDIYETEDVSTLDVVLGARSIQEAMDKIDYLRQIGDQDQRIARAVAQTKRQVREARAHTAKIRGSVRSETHAISVRTSQTRDVRDQLVGARNDLSASKQEKLTDLSTLSAQERAEAEEIDSLQAVSASLGAQIRAAQARAASQQGTFTPVPSSSGLIWPVNAPVTSPFGWRWGRMHEGIDLGAPSGTPIHAAASGTVIYCGWEGGYGNLTVIDHGNNLATAYGHQSSIAVACGQQVTQGQTIGYVGSTGHSTGPHLHFEVRVNGNAVDPLGYL